jgi:hypothetical protein
MTNRYFACLFLVLVQSQLFAQFRDLPMSFGLGVDVGTTNLISKIPLNDRMRPSVGLSLNCEYKMGYHSEMFADAFLHRGSFLLNEETDPNYKYGFTRIGVRYGLSWDVGAAKKWKLGPFVTFAGIFGDEKIDFDPVFCNPDDPTACVSADDLYSFFLDTNSGVRIGYKHKKYLFGTMLSVSVLNLQDEPETQIRNGYAQFFVNYYLAGEATKDKNAPTKKHNW